VHSYFNDDIVAWALGKAFKKAAETGGLCDQYQRHAANLPVDIAVPLLPGVTVRLEKVCAMLQHPSCEGDQPGAASSKPSN